MIHRPGVRDVEEGAQVWVAPPTPSGRCLTGVNAELPAAKDPTML